MNKNSSQSRSITDFTDFMMMERQPEFKKSTKLMRSPPQTPIIPRRATTSNSCNQNNLEDENKLLKANIEQINKELEKYKEGFMKLNAEIEMLKNKNKPLIETNQEKPRVEYCTDEEELARDTEEEWKVIQRSKRKRLNNTLTPPEQYQKKETNYKESTQLSNKAKKIPLPPPIVIEDIIDYNELREIIKNIIKNEPFEMKVISKDRIKVNLKNGEDYRKVKQVMEKENFVWHSYENKQSRPIRVMAKNLHYTCRENSI